MDCKLEPALPGLRRLILAPGADLVPGCNMAQTPRGLPLPPVVHATVGVAALKHGRAIIVGDVHGCPAELNDLLSKCQFDSGRDKLILVGDLVGKGLQSGKAVQMARELHAYCVRGNWDEDALAARQLLQQGQPVPAQHAVFLDQLTAEDWAYLEQLPFSLTLPGHGVLVTHAGLLPGVPLEEQRLHDLIDMRHVDQVATLDKVPSWKIMPKFPRDAGVPWGSAYAGESGHVVFGHHARRRLQCWDHCTGIDTGCVLGDTLTALVLPSLSELEARGWKQPASGAAGATGSEEGAMRVTREALGVTLVSVPAHQAYSK